MTLIKKKAWVILKGDMIMDIYLYKETLEEYLKSPGWLLMDNLGGVIKECHITYETENSHSKN